MSDVVDDVSDDVNDNKMILCIHSFIHVFIIINSHSLSDEARYNDSVVYNDNDITDSLMIGGNRVVDG